MNEKSRSSLVVSVVVVASLVLVPGARAQVTVGPESPTCIPRAEPPDVALELVEDTQHSDRLVELTLRSEAMVGEMRYGEAGVQPVYVLLPKGYDPSGATRYPVLYLLHGFTGDYTDYVDGLEIERIVGDRQVIVVMPDGGYNGAYTDWYGRVPGAGGTGEPPAWETYHLRELVPFIDDHFPTTGTREGRAVAGISSGGHGAIKYAAREPDLFVAAGSLSGALNISQDWPFYPTFAFLSGGALSVATGEGDASNCALGDPYTQQVFLEDSNPFYLASNLHGVDLWLSSGDGGDGVEDYIRRMNEWFIGALEEAGIPYTNTFRPGTHSAPFWVKDLEALVPWVMNRFADPPDPPEAFSYRGMSENLEAWGWSFDGNKDVKEFTYVDGISPDGFTISGSGNVDVETAALYLPGETYRITGLDEPLQVEVGPDGRLRFAVDLGPPHIVQQYRFRCRCWNDLDSEHGLVDVFGDDPELRGDWVTRGIRIEPASP